MQHLHVNKFAICAAAGTLGTCIASIFGGWSSDLKTLLILMLVDYIMGIVIAGVFKKSTKSKNGALSSEAGLKGIIKKCGALVCVIIAVQVDSMLQVDYIRTLVIITLVVNELISIVENLGIMGVPVPKPLLKAIDVLKNKSEGDGDDNA